MVSCMLLSQGHKQPKHQDYQRPRSHGYMWNVVYKRGFGNVVCNCNFVICTVKYTHTCALGTEFKLVDIMGLEVRHPLHRQPL
jgi:hypothetical protein